MAFFYIHQDNGKILGKYLCKRFQALLLKNENNEVFLGMVEEKHLPILQDTVKKHSQSFSEVVKITPQFFYQNFKFLSLQENLITHQDNAGDLFAFILREAIAFEASDIHLEDFRGSGWLRFRINGDLESVAMIPAKSFKSLCSKIKLDSKLDITEIKQSQDGYYSLILDSKNYDFRISVVPLFEGESIVIRVLYKDKTFLRLEDLNFSTHHLELIKKNSQKTHGMILITGPTGSGKSSTQYAILQNLQHKGLKIITIEDPIEYKMAFATQIQVHPDFSFASALRSILRQDPDVIMVGEIRDQETLSLAFRAALTGHLVIATLHSNDVQSSFERLIYMGSDLHQILTSVLMIISQRLIKTLCPQCKKLGVGGYMADGCEYCNMQGVFGREVVSEILELNDEVKSQIKKYGLDSIFNKEFETLYKNARSKAKAGYFNQEEIEKLK